MSALQKAVEAAIRADQGALLALEKIQPPDGFVFTLDDGSHSRWCVTLHRCD
jgi:hypothetical protein